MKRSEIWRINLDPSVGAEMQKTRRCIIVNDDAVGVLPLRVVIPITEWKERYNSAPWMVKLEMNKQNQLTKTSTADCFQVRSVSTDRIVDKVGELSESDMAQIRQGLAIVLKIT